MIRALDLHLLWLRPSVTPLTVWPRRALAEGEAPFPPMIMKCDAATYWPGMVASGILIGFHLDAGNNPSNLGPMLPVERWLANCASNASRMGCTHDRPAHRRDAGRHGVLRPSRRVRHLSPPPSSIRSRAAMPLLHSGRSDAARRTTHPRRPQRHRDHPLPQAIRRPRNLRSTAPRTPRLTVGAAPMCGAYTEAVADAHVPRRARHSPVPELASRPSHRHDRRAVSCRPFACDGEAVALVEGDGPRIRRVQVGGQMIYVDDL
jgi:hypothetical protein